MDYPVWKSWPPEGNADKARWADITKNRYLFRGDHKDIFERARKWLGDFQKNRASLTLIYVACNFSGLLSRVCADMLFSEKPIFRVGDPLSTQGKQAQQYLDDLLFQNAIQTLGYESLGLGCSWRGGSILKSRWDSESEKALIEPVNATYFFPQLDEGNVKKMKGCSIAWEFIQDDIHYLRREIHLPGTIINKVYLLDGGEIKGEQPLEKFTITEGLKEIVDTKYNDLLVQYVPNWAMDDEFWGISDYHDIESLIEALNDRLSRTHKTLNMHSEPKLLLPPGIMEEDPERPGRYYVDKETLDAIEVDLEEGSSDLPRYMVWDAKLDAAFQEIDTLMEILMMVSETSPAAFGLDKNGTIESGRALKYKLMRTIAKAQRKRLYADIGLKKAIHAAMALGYEHGRSNIEPEYPEIEWRDGIPDDATELTTNISTQHMAGLISREKAIMRLQKIGTEAAQEEIKKIQEEKEAAIPTVENPEINLGGNG